MGATTNGTHMTMQSANREFGPRITGTVAQAPYFD
jgi:hypothetical protein